MEFLVRIEVGYPPDRPSEERDRLIAAEMERAEELAANGTIRRLWRLPGRWANVGIWRADDASALHEALSSLPFFPWLDITVTALAAHPSDPGPAEEDP